MYKKKTITFIILLSLIGNNLAALGKAKIEPVVEPTKYPDYSYIYLGRDKHEKYNRKMFNFDLGLNKYVIKPIHILWATIMPQYCMDRIFCFSNNIEYPIRLVSSLIQKDFHNAGNETKRFLMNTTVGIAGLFDPAKRYLKIYRSYDNMDKALARRNIKPGTFFVAPVIMFTTVRGLFGRVLDMAFNPTTYIGTPVLAVIKACITINRTSYMQPILELVESNYADPYDVTKKAFGINGCIKKNNFDRIEVQSTLRTDNIAQNTPDDDDDVLVSEKKQKTKKTKLSVSSKIVDKSTIYMGDENAEVIESLLGLENVSVKPNLHLEGYNPQGPVSDSMRTSLFKLADVHKSIWNELSPWNRSFANRMKKDKINIVEGRDDYMFKYLLQKDKHSPLAIIYPSTGDGVKANHPLTFAKMFYDAGYSVIIQGNPFQWEFVKSMPSDYRPGLPARDALLMRATTTRIIDKLQKKYGYEFGDKVLLGTSLAALDIMFIAEQESQDNSMGNTKYIAICPPIDLMYSMKKVDSITDEWRLYPDEFKERFAVAAAKIVNLYLIRNDINFDINSLPFTEDEAKLITGFLMHQKLSDIIFTIENAPKNKPSDIYNTINNMGYNDYFEKYIMPDMEAVSKELNHGFGLIAISDYLENANNYKIYHTKNDYLINKTQLKQLKRMAGDKLIIMDNGSHMGFLYKKEFQNDLRKTIADFKKDEL